MPGDVSIPSAVHRIKFQEMGERLRIAVRLIDVNDVQIWPVPGRAKCQASDAAKSVYSNSCGHAIYV